MSRLDRPEPLKLKAGKLHALWSALTCGSLALMGCGGHNRVNPIGGGPSAGAGGAGAASAGVAASSGTGEAAPVELAGTWFGYAENYQFFDQSDAITLVLSSDGTGKINFGDSPPLEPLSDPNVGYPKARLDAEGNQVGIGLPLPGYAYTIRNFSADSSRLQFDVEFSEVWTEWCTVQTPIWGGVGLNGADLDEYFCVPNWPTTWEGELCSQQDPMTMQNISVDCAKTQLCLGGFCDCTANECSAANVGAAHFDLSLDAAKASGSFLFSDGKRGFTAPDGLTPNVYLTKRTP